MNLKPKKYIILFFIIILAELALAVAYSCKFTKKYPAPITNRISLDAKLKFIREKINPNKIDTIIVGSSIGMNNVLGSVLEKSSNNVKNALNISVYEATTLQSEQLLELSSAFPNLKRVIYSAQYSDFPHARRYKNFNAEVLRKYIRNELSSAKTIKLLFNACNNLKFCQERAKKWKNEHLQPDKFTSLVFDHTASVPLKIYKQEKVGGRWYLPHPPIMHNESFNAVERMAKKFNKQGIKFYLAHQPYRPELYKKHKKVRDAIKYFDSKTEPKLKKYGQYLIKLQNVPLDNSHFADRTHLNDKGATIVTKKIAEYIDKIEGVK